MTEAANPTTVPPATTVGSRQAKDALFDALAQVGRALGNGRRGEIVELLIQADRSVEEIAAAIDQSVANTSHHLQTLAAAGLVERERAGRQVIYRLARPVYDMWAAIRAVAAQRVPGITPLADQYLGDRSQVATISAAELRRSMEAGAVILIDVRPEPEYAAGHIRGAISVPPHSVADWVPERRDRKNVVAYCRGPFCVYADDAVRALMRRGLTAYRLEDGFPEWRRTFPELTTAPGAATVGT